MTKNQEDAFEVARKHFSSAAATAIVWRDNGEPIYMIGCVTTSDEDKLQHEFGIKAFGPNWEDAMDMFTAELGLDTLKQVGDKNPSGMTSSK